MCRATFILFNSIRGSIFRRTQLFSLKTGGGFIGLIIYKIVLIILLAIAVLMDLKYDRIYNYWIVFGIFLGLVLNISENGRYGAGNSLISMLLSFCVLYPLYKIGGLGAGDVKLFIMTGSFIKADRLPVVIMISFIIGAVPAVVKMLSERNFRERMYYLLSYMSDVIKSGHWKLYGEDIRDDHKKYKTNKIHFALPIYCSVMLELGGFF